LEIMKSQEVLSQTATNATEIELNSDRNRENQISRRDDNAQNLKVSIGDIDEAVMYYFKNVILPNVKVNGSILDVPVMYANPEKWVAVQRNGFYRDKNGKQQLPLILFKRNSLTKNRRITSKVDANYPHNFYVTGVHYSKRNYYDRFDLLNNRIPEEEYILTVVPDYVTINYSCIILTDYITQMNPIIEAINFASDSYWGDPERFKFQAFVDSFRSEVRSTQTEDRTIQTSFELKLNGYIVPDTVNASAFTSQKRYRKTNYRLNFKEGILVEGL